MKRLGDKQTKHKHKISQTCLSPQASKASLTCGGLPVEHVVDDGDGPLHLQGEALRVTQVLHQHLLLLQLTPLHPLCASALLTARGGLLLGRLGILGLLLLLL